MTMEQRADSSWATDAGWVDEVLLAGREDQVCFRVPDIIDRAELPPSIAYVANLLAVWQLGAQAILLDYRLTDHEVEQARRRLSPQLMVAPRRVAGGLRVFFDVEDVITSYGDQPAGSEHAVVQLSSGSTGPSKVIGRTADDLIAEVRRYTQIEGVALPGERIILLPSMVHVLGLVGGLLYGLHAGVELTPPRRLTGDSILDAIEGADNPATVLGVPFHISLLNSTTARRRPRQLRRMITGGELVPAATVAAFLDRYQVPLGNMYGMTEVGVIGTDLDGSHRPSVRPAPGITVRARDGELQIARAASPYLGEPVPDRWSDGWLRTRDAGTVDPDTGLVTILGRLDSQVTIGGLQVDLAEVEASIGALPGVVAAVVLFDQAITAYLQLEPGSGVEDVEARLGAQLARFKQPQVYQVFDQFPRTTTGKLVRDLAVLQAASR